jgi:invasion protein IalB
VRGGSGTAPILLFAALALGLAAPAGIATAQEGAAAEAPAALPGGASSLRETHGAWVVSCVQQQAKSCSLSQSQVDKNSGKRVLAIELGAPAGDVVNGVLVLPFGLLLDQGVTLQVDDGEPGAAMRFHTCLPAGCVVRLSFDAAMLTKLRAGTALKVNAAAAENGSPVAFSISLAGLTSALDRVAELMG